MPILSDEEILVSPTISATFPSFMVALTLGTQFVPTVPVTRDGPPVIMKVERAGERVETTVLVSIPRWSTTNFGMVRAAEGAEMGATGGVIGTVSLKIFYQRTPSAETVVLSEGLSPKHTIADALVQSSEALIPPIARLLSPPSSQVAKTSSPMVTLSSVRTDPSAASPSTKVVSPTARSGWSPFFG